MSNTTEPITLILPDQRIEVLRSSAVRGLISRHDQYLLVALDARNQLTGYTLDVSIFLATHQSENQMGPTPPDIEEGEDATTLAVRTSRAVFDAIFQGRPFHVLGRQAVEIKAATTAA